MHPIIKQLPKLNKYMEYINDVKKNIFPISISGLTDAQKTHFAYSTLCYTNSKICIITYNEIQAKYIMKDLQSLNIEDVILLPKRENIFFDYDVESRENSRIRANALAKILKNEASVVVTTIEAISQPVIEKEYILNNIIQVKQGEEINIEILKRHLVNSGYEKVDMVEVKGQFSIRGGIVDVFPNNLENGVRIELFGEEVDSIRTFNCINQRSIDSINNVEIFPAEEYVIEINEIEKIVSNIRLKYMKTIHEEKVLQDIEEIENGNYINKIDKYFNLFYSKKVNILEYFSDEFNFFIDEPERIVQREESLIFENQEVIKSLIDKKRFVPQYLNEMYTKVEILESLEKKKIIYLQRLEKNFIDINMPAKRKEYSFNCREVNFFRNSMDLFIKEIKQHVEKEKIVVLLFQNETKALNIFQELQEQKIRSKYTKNIEELDLEDNVQVHLTMGFSTNSYEYVDLNTVVITDTEEQQQKPKKIGKSAEFRKAEKIVIDDLEQGDYVVHMSHGIGQFIGIDNLNVNNIRKDYIKVKYKDNDMLYIPTNQLDSIRKYVAINDGAVKINKLGTKEWTKAKAKAKESIDNIAKQLIELYAQREKLVGYSFLPDTDWQKQFEENFPYEETPDQLRCIREIKQNMEKSTPMDRLLCGDVGYGKTEVAIRAAFKAVMSGKQVAYLVPTTVLADQQYESFKDRMEEYDIRVAVLNRFRSKKEQKDILAKLALGEYDIVVGTHRLLQKDVKFKDLGLLIIDEEHRFGVKDKEAMKELRKNIDVLSMTATPIPRTLHMSIVGIRDMSVIYDPPNNRKPVQTYVLEYDKYLIQDAIIREMERDGQVFYLYNKVEDIESKSFEIQEMVPNAIVEFAHGQMTGTELERIMHDFANRKIDVLVCTTILESGIDIPNANTIIIENADRLGLAQLYQIRGRVGRKDRQAYAYITYRKNKMLSEVAEKRLKAIKEFTEFGSGFKIALRDLEIRGAGNILGAEQHGHMEAIGYEMYCKLLEDAISMLKGETILEESEIQIDIDVSAYIPDEYISVQNQKIEVYQNIALCKNFDDIDEIIDEVIDRYGAIPKEVENLIEIAKIKIIAKKIGIESIVNKGNNIKILISKNNNIKNENMQKLIDKYRLEITIKDNLIVKRLKSTENNDILKTINEFLNILI